ncbi:MAG: hypothetical protein E6562_08510 [Pantoea sp.]|uniref:hypothetical protein n=1 Tax=Pantoea sp. TaxID=69393 RepID=UPI00290916E3|nr:hypothetical protein [Pantoea sp.]MDU6388618.1 hypothetical protein [Pantoea sp.]
MSENEQLFFIVVKQQLVNIVAGLLLLLLSYYAFERFSYSDAKDVLGALINISASVFTIVGLWVGFLYPNAMSSIVKDDISYIKNEKDSPRIERLVYTIITSALVMAGILIFFLLKATITATPLYKAHLEGLRFWGTFTVFYLSWMQLKCIFSVVASNLHFVNHLHGRLAKARLEHYDQ